MSDVRCADCGYLGLREKHIREICEAETEFREKANLPPETGVSSGLPCKRFETTPLCFMQVESFARFQGDGAERRRIGNFAINSEGRSGLLEVIQRPRECDCFTAWQQGFTPKEHAEMNLHRSIIEAQSKREEADRHWREESDRRDREWREQQARIAEDRHRSQQEDDRKWRKEDLKSAEDRHTKDLVTAEGRHRSNLRALIGTAVGTMLVTLAAAFITMWGAKQEPPTINVHPPAVPTDAPTAASDSSRTSEP